MSVAAVMLVKDEADIVGYTVGHLLENVDQVFVADNASTDGTRDVLEAVKLAAGGDAVTILYDDEVGYWQARKTTRLAHLARECGHRWVIPCDADEWWYAPEGRTLRDWLDGVGRETQFVKAAIYNHIATAVDAPAEENPIRRLGWRQRTPLDRRWWKVACRTRPDLEIGMGNHDARTTATGTMGYGLELRHFPYRSAEHFVRKARNGAAAYKATDDDPSMAGYGSHWRIYGQAVEEGGDEAGRAWFYDAFFSADPHGDDSLTHDPAPGA